MNIAYFGCDISLKVFQKLIDCGHRIVALYTFYNPYDLVHEKKMTELARDKGIEVHYEKMTLKKAEDMFDLGSCDLFVSAEYNQKIPIPQYGRFKGVNVHNSLLPEGKGFFTVETRKFLQIPRGGVTFHKLTNDFDEGDVIIQEEFPLCETDDILKIYQKCEAVSEKMCQTIFESDEIFGAYWDNAKAQQGTSSIWYPTKEERAIAPSMTVEHARHLFLCYDRYTFAHVDDGLRRVMSIHEGDPLNPMGRTLIEEKFDFIPYRLEDGVLWLALEA